MNEEDQVIALCNSKDLVDGGQAVAFDVIYGGQSCRAFAIRFEGQVHAYLNRCSHVAMELDYREGQFFDDTGRWLLCATHGAASGPTLAHAMADLAGAASSRSP